MITHAHEHVIDRVLERDERHVRKQIGVARMIECQAVFDRQYDASWRSAVDRRLVFARHHRGPVPGGNETRGHFAIEHFYGAADVRDIAAVFIAARKIERVPHRCRAIERARQFGFRLLRDLYCVADMIEMAVSETNYIRAIELV